MFNPYTRDYDYAMIALQNAVPSYIPIMALPDADDWLSAGTSGLGFFWDLLGKAVNWFLGLFGCDVNVLNSSVCQQVFDGFTSRMICAGNPNETPCLGRYTSQLIVIQVFIYRGTWKSIDVPKKFSMA